MNDFDLFLKLIEENLESQPEENTTELQKNQTQYESNEINPEYIQNINEKYTFKNYKPTNLRVSTITICANINLDKSIKTFVNKTIIQKHCCKKCYQLFYDIDNHKCNTILKKKGSFYNQQTILIKLSNGKKVNFKIFWNGKVQITGLKSHEDGKEAIHHFINELHKLHKLYTTQDNWVVTDLNLLQLNDFKICLINSDFAVNFKIKRNQLYELLKQKYEISVSYEPDYYQGVNSKFYWNKQNHNGRCLCNHVQCNGKGKGNGNGDCKKVTISIFQSGKIIITGAQTYLQIKDAYCFINSVLDNEFKLVKRNEITIQKTDDLINQQTTYLQKTNIQNFYLYKQLLKNI